jgi:acetyl esterase/lipase
MTIHRSISASIQWFSLALSGLGLFLSSWIVIPAPTFSLLPLAVGAPEISPLLLLGNVFLLGFALLQRQRKLIRFITISCSIIAIVLSSIPLIQLPTTLQQADSRMQTALGANYLTQIAPVQIAQMRARPVVITDFITGLPTSTVQRHHQVFSPGNGTNLELEIYRLNSTGLHPAIITIYGGAWQRGEPNQHALFNSYMAAQGYTVVAIDYRHAPRYRFPIQIQDVQAALQWINQNAARYNIDTTRMALVGWSAGAHLALLAAYQTDTIPVRAVVNYYGPTNLTAGYYDPPFPDPIDTKAVLEAFLGGSPAQFPQRYESASPIRYVKPGLPPTLLIYGSRDHVVKPIFGQQLYDQLQTTDNTAVLIALPWAEHAFDAIFQGLSNQIALYHTERFLAWVLNKQNPVATNQATTTPQP